MTYNSQTERWKVSKLETFFLILKYWNFQFESTSNLEVPAKRQTNISRSADELIRISSMAANSVHFDYEMKFNEIQWNSILAEELAPNCTQPSD